MRRTLDQNRKLWPLLEEVAAQATLGGKQYDAEDWKVIFMSALHKSQKIQVRLIYGIYGEPINLGRSTSKLDKELFSDLIELILAFGAENGVVFKDD